MARRPRQSSSTENLSRRSFIERVVGGTAAAPALGSLAGAWLAAETTALAASSRSSRSTSQSISLPASGSPAASGSGSSYGSSAPLPASSASQASSASGPAGGPVNGILYADADSTLRRNAPNTNEGANPRIHVSAGPVRRGIVHFEPYWIGSLSAQVQGGASAYLRLTIAENNNEWGQTDDHVVDVHPLPPNFYFPEGDGAITGLPSWQATNGSGAGVTWNSAADPSIDDNRKNARKHDPNHWEGGDDVMGPATAPGQVHVNQQTGVVEWEVTDDLAQGVNAWIVIVRDERHGKSDDGPRKGDEKDKKKSKGADPQIGDDAFRGGVAYYSREGAGGDPTLAPQLEVVQYSGGSSSAASGSSSASGGSVGASGSVAASASS